MDVASIMTRDPIAVGPDARLGRVIALMDEHDVRHLPVVEDGTPVGVVSDRQVLGTTGWLRTREREGRDVEEPSVDDVMRTGPFVGPREPIERVLELFRDEHVGCVPVVDGRTLTGIVTEVDVLRAYADACRRGDVRPESDPRIESYMTSDPVVVTGDLSGDELEVILKRGGMRHVPVVDGGKLVGIVSDRDVRRARGRGELQLTLVSELMSPSPETASPRERLSSAALILSAERIGALPVLEHGELVGIATTIDVMPPCVAALRAL